MFACINITKQGQMDIQITSSRVIRQKQVQEPNQLQNEAKITSKQAQQLNNGEKNSQNILGTRSDKYGQNPTMKPNQMMNVSRNQSNNNKINKSEISGSFAFQSLEHQQEIQSKNKLLNRNVSQFSQAWKLENSLGVLLVQKLSMIVQNYFKIMPELSKRMQEIQVLVVYNKALIQILNKFENHQRKIIQKLKSMQELNLKAMKELCAIKNRQFKPPEIKTQQSIFAKFSLKNYAYKSEPKLQLQLSQSCLKKINQFFKIHLLKPIKSDIIDSIEQKIRIAELKEQQSNNKQIRDDLNVKCETLELKQLRQSIRNYNQEIQDANLENMFDLYNKMLGIKEQMQKVNVEKQVINQNQQEELRKLFAKQVEKIHTGLTKLDESQIVQYLRRQKQTRRKLRKQRMKQQESFYRVFSRIESQNTELQNDVATLKQKSLYFQQECNRIKAENNFKYMKYNKAGRSNPNNNTSISNLNDQSVFQESQGKVSKRLVKQTQNQLQNNLKKLKQQNTKLKQENAKLTEIIKDFKLKQNIRAERLKQIKQKAHSAHINFAQNWQQIKIIEFLLKEVNPLKQAEQNSKNKGGTLKVNFIGGEHRQDQLYSPNLDINLNSLNFDAAQTAQNALFLKTIHQQSQVQGQDNQTQIINKNKQLQRANQDLQNKNEENKKIIQKLNISLIQLNNNIIQKNYKINQLVKQYEGFQNQIRQMRFLNGFLINKNVLSGRFCQSMVSTLQQIQKQGQFTQKIPQINQEKIYQKSQQKLLQRKFQVIQFIVNKFQQAITAYNTEVKKQQQMYDLNRLVIIQRNIDRQENSSINRTNPNDNSIASMRSKLGKAKEKSELISSSPGKDEENKGFKSILFKKIKSLTSLSNENVEIQLQKQSPKVSNKKSLSPFLKQKTQKNANDRQDQNSSSSQNDPQRKLSGLLNIGGKDQIAKTEQNANSVVIDKSKNMSAEDLKMSVGNLQSIQCNFLDFLHGSQRKQNIFNNSGSDINKKSTDEFTKKYSQPPQNNIKKLSQSFKLQKHEQEKQQQNKDFKKKIQKKNNQDQNLARNTPKIKKQVMNNNSKISSSQKQQNVSDPQVQNQKNKKLDGPSKTSQQRNKQMSEQSKKNRSGIQEQGSHQNTRFKQNQQLISQRSGSESRNQNMPQQSNINDRNSFSNVNLSYTKTEINNNNTNMNRNPTQGGQNMIENQNINIKKYASRQRKKNKQINKQSQSRETFAQKSRIQLLNINKQDPHHRIPMQDHQRILQKIKKLSDTDDVLDFAELYQRYKQALYCLQEAQSINRYQMIRYQRFVNQLKTKQKTENYNVQEQLFYLYKLVNEQQIRIKEDDIRFNEKINLHIKNSQMIIGKQLKMMRDNFKNLTKKEEQRRRRDLWKESSNSSSNNNTVQGG